MISVAPCALSATRNRKAHDHQQLREALFRSPRDWRAKKSEIKERYPTADVSYLTEEEDPAQKGDLHLEPKADTEMTWEEFRSLPRGVRESTEGFQTRVNTAKEVLGELTESRRQRTGKQPGEFRFCSGSTGFLVLYSTSPS